MSLLQRGIDRSVIALWLGHESVGASDYAESLAAFARDSPRQFRSSRYVLGIIRHSELWR